MKWFWAEASCVSFLVFNRLSVEEAPADNFCMVLVTLPSRKGVFAHLLWSKGLLSALPDLAPSSPARQVLSFSSFQLWKLRQGGQAFPRPRSPGRMWAGVWTGVSGMPETVTLVVTTCHNRCVYYRWNKRLCDFSRPSLLKRRVPASAWFRHTELPCFMQPGLNEIQFTPHKCTAESVQFSGF